MHHINYADPTDKVYIAGQWNCLLVKRSIDRANDSFFWQSVSSEKKRKEKKQTLPGPIVLKYRWCSYIFESYSPYMHILSMIL